MFKALDRPGGVIHGFELQRIEWVGEAGSWARVFIHLQSNARLLYLSNQDDNKVFSITFRTPPRDNTGLTHILEHMVLCGSRKFPVKAPFHELLKGSLQTYLNARTSADRTIYVFATRNDKDFINLMDVHLDAVFFPRFYSVPEIFRQEGWRYDVAEETGAFRYNGIVYNEMQAAFSSPEQVLHQTIRNSLFPDGTYGLISGGDPTVIPQTTQEAIQTVHQAYYHPSNSFIFLYGDGDVKAHLRFLDEAYLQHFNKREIGFHIALQPPFDAPREIVTAYPVDHAGPLTGRTYLSLNYAVGRSTDPEHRLAFEILNHILFGSPVALVRRALLAGGLGLDARGEFESSILHSYFSIIALGCDPGDKSRFREAVERILRVISDTGMDEGPVQSGIASVEFARLEPQVRGAPRGLVYNLLVLDSWLYDSDPLAHLAYSPSLEQIKRKARKGYFEAQIKEHLLENNHQTLIVLKPGRGQAEENAVRIQRQLANLRGSLSVAELKHYKEEVNHLETWWSTPDSSQDLQTIPALTLDDLQSKALKSELPMGECEVNGCKVLLHPVGTSGIIYLDLYFDAAAVPKNLIPYVSLLASVLARVNTENYEYGHLIKELNAQTCSFEYEATSICDKSSMAVFYPRIVVKGKAPANRVLRLLELVSEGILRSQFTDQYRLRELVRRARAQSKAKLQLMAPMIAMERSASYFSPYHRYRDLTTGLNYYQFLSDIDNAWDENARTVSANLRKVAEIIFDSTNLLVSMTAEEADFHAATEHLVSFIGKLPATSLQRQTYDFRLARTNEGIAIPSSVQAVAQSGDFVSAGYSFSGHMLVLSTILNGSYLWNEIRHGGAHGAFMRIERYGLLGCFSYSDPHLARTLNIYEHMGDFLRRFNPSEHEMRRIIIGTVGRLDQSLTSVEKRESIAYSYITHLTQADLEKTREEVLATTVEDIRGLAPMCQKVMEEKNLCVFGGEQKLKENARFFGRITWIDAAR